MVNKVSCNEDMLDSAFQPLTSETLIEAILILTSMARILFKFLFCYLSFFFYYDDVQVTIEIPFAFRAIPVEVIESTGRQVLEQLLRIMLPRFLKQVISSFFTTGSSIYFAFK